MKTRMMLWAIVVVVAVVAVPCWGRDTIIKAHCHTNYSDGCMTIDEVAGYWFGRGVDTVILADHAEHVEHESIATSFGDVGTVAYQGQKRAGIMNWMREFEVARAKYARAGKILAPGLEIGLGIGHTSHLLFFGGKPDALVPDSFLEGTRIKDLLEERRQPVQLYPVLVAFSEFQNDNEDTSERDVRFLVNLAKAARAMLVMAHPTHFKYPFECLGKGIRMSEVFNGTDAEDDLLSFANRDRPIFVMGGCDFHGAVGYGFASLASLPGDDVVTVNPSNGMTMDSIIPWTYGAKGDARIISCNGFSGPLKLNGTLEITTNLSGDTPFLGVAIPVGGTDTRQVEGWCQNGDLRLELSRFEFVRYDKWLIYVAIGGKIVTSALVVEGSDSKPQVSDREPESSSSRRIVIKCPPPYVAPAPSGEKFVGREQWGDGTIAATYIRRDERFGTLYLQYAPSGNIYRYPIDLEQNCQGLERCEIPERILMERTEEGRTERLSTDEESTAIQHMKATKRSPEYYILDFGYAFPAGNTPQARVGGITGTPNIKLYRAQE